MTNNVKFRLHFGNNEIETLDDLRKNFFIEDIVKNYKNGMLAEWLELNGYKDEFRKVKSIKAKDTHSVLIELIHIFHIADNSSAPHNDSSDKERAELLERCPKLGGNHPMPRKQKTDDPW